MPGKEKEGDAERIRKLAEFKEALEKKIADVEIELERLKILLEFVDKTLLERGFKRAEAAKPRPVDAALPAVMEYKTVVPLKTINGELLANLYISQDSMRVSVAGDKTFNVKMPPFQQFLVERVFNRMQEKDKEAASKGEIDSEKMFSYELILEGDVLREIVVKNLSPDRLRELKSSIHWTFEKMYEKTAEKGT